MNIAIIGTGVYALAMANALSKGENNHIKMWSESEQSLNAINENRHKLTNLGDIDLVDDVKISTSYKEVLEDAELVFVMCAAKFVGSVAVSMQEYITSDMDFIIGSKGIERDSCRFVHEVFQSHINTDKVAVISGPSFAIDIASLEPIGLSIASTSQRTIDKAMLAYEGTNIKLRATSDLVGVELCGSIKNVIAVAAGILEGLGYSESTRSFLITESLHDIKELIKVLGGESGTILSFAGVGDLLLTATSTKSRNYSYGALLGSSKYDCAEEFLRTNTVEGYYTLESIYSLLANKHIALPIIDLIRDIVVNHGNPDNLAKFLMEKK